MKEIELQRGIVAVARVLGYHHVHFRAAKTEEGWRTPVSGDGKGFPDLILVRPGRLIFAELKGSSGRVSPEQRAWGARLDAAGSEWYLWTPAEWLSGEIERLLRAAPAPARVSEADYESGAMDAEGFTIAHGS